MTDFARHADERNVLESLLRKIPGFRGYLEKEYRRDSDQLARQSIVASLQQVKKQLDQVQRSLLDAGQLDALPIAERVRHRLEALAAKVGGAVQGYSGMFDFVRVDEALLDDVYELDLRLVDEAALLAQSLSSAAPPQDAVALFADVLSQVANLEQQFSRRGDLLQGLTASH